MTYFRVCANCGRPTPGEHAPECPDAGSGVVEVAKPVAPREHAALRTQLAEVTRERDEARDVLKTAWEDPDWDPGADAHHIQDAP